VLENRGLMVVPEIRTEEWQDVGKNGFC